MRRTTTMSLLGLFLAASVGVPLPSAPARAGEPNEIEAGEVSSGSAAEASGSPSVAELPVIGYAEARHRATLGFTPEDAPDLSPDDAAIDPHALDVLAVTGERVRFRQTSRVATWAVWIHVAALAPLVVSPRELPFGDAGAQVRVHSGVAVIPDPAAGTARAVMGPSDLEWLVELELPLSATGPVAEAAPAGEFFRTGSLELEPETVLYARPSRLGVPLARLGTWAVAVEPAPGLEPVDGFRAVVVESPSATVTAWVLAHRVEDSAGGCAAMGMQGYGAGGSAHDVWVYPEVGARIYGGEAGEAVVGEVHTSDRLLQRTRGKARTAVSLSADGWTVVGWIPNDALFAEPVP